jgi:hypothetical protein
MADNQATAQSKQSACFNLERGGRNLQMVANDPDVVLLSLNWRERVALRAQLIEEGYDVVATDAWPMPKTRFAPPPNPRVLLIDLHGLSDPRKTLDDVRSVIPPDRVVVVTALGSLAADEVGRLGFHALERPITIGQIVATTAALLRG